MKVLVIVAHLDGEFLGCGATAARLVIKGYDGSFAILGEGLTSRHPDPGNSDGARLTALHRQAQAAAAKAGVKRVVLHNLPDNRLDTMPRLEVVKIVEGLMEDLRSEVVYTHHGGDRNFDHGVIHRALLTATRPTVGQAVREIYVFEIPTSTEWAFQRMEPSFRPHVFVEVTHTIEAKIAEMECYESEARKLSQPRSPEALRALATRWESVVGCAAAEAFELVRSVRLQPN